VETTIEIPILPFLTISLALAIAFVIGFVRLFETYKKRINMEVDKKHHIEKDFERRLIEASLESEEINRSQFAMDIHDDIGALLTILKMKVNHAHAHPEEFKNQEEIYEQTQFLIEQTIEKIRQITHRISPPSLQHFGIIPPLQELVLAINESQQLDIKLHHEIEGLRYSSFIEVNLFRIVQECLNNILKHAQATEAAIQIFEDNTGLLPQLHVEIKHNGDGLSDDQVQDILHQSKGHGLKGIFTRIQSIKGSIRFVRHSNESSAINIRITSIDSKP
jgi:two-component system NarL family sensor kinase